MSDGSLDAVSGSPAKHVLTADSNDKASNLTRGSDRLLRSQRWRSVAELAAKDEVSPAAGLDPLQWESLSAIPESHTTSVPDLDWLLDLNSLAQTAVPHENADNQQGALLQVMLFKYSSRMGTYLGKSGKPGGKLHEFSISAL